MSELHDEAIALLKGKRIEIPDDNKEIINLFFGAHIIEKLNYWVDYTNDYIDNPEPETPYNRPSSTKAKEDKAYRDSFSLMNDEQKSQVKKLLRESLEGILFSTFLLFDQPPVGDWKISVDGKSTTALLTADKELHEDFYKWIEMFGKSEDNE